MRQDCGVLQSLPLREQGFQAPWLQAHFVREDGCDVGVGKHCLKSNSPGTGASRSWFPRRTGGGETVRKQSCRHAVLPVHRVALAESREIAGPSVPHEDPAVAGAALARWNIALRERIQRWGHLGYKFKEGEQAEYLPAIGTDDSVL